MWTIIIILLCIALNAGLAAFEIAFVRVSSSLLRIRAKEDERASQLLGLKEHPERTLSTIQIGITLLAALSAAVGGAAAGLKLVPLLEEKFHLSFTVAEVIAVLFVVIPITYLSVVVGEITPKALAIRNPYYFAKRGAPVLNVLRKLLYPIVKICEWSTKKLLKIIPFQRDRRSDEESGDSAYEQVLMGYRRLPSKGKEYMTRLGKIQEKTVEDILLKWEEVDYITTDLDMAKIEDKIISSGHTRMPVVENNKIIGLMNTKEVLALSKSKGHRRWKELIREPVRLRRNDSPLISLAAMQKKRMHMAIVEEENGKPIGIVTIEDIIEEFIGEIYDEDDEGSLQRILQQKR